MMCSCRFSTLECFPVMLGGDACHRALHNISTFLAFNKNFRISRSFKKYEKECNPKPKNFEEKCFDRMFVMTLARHRHQYVLEKRSVVH